MVSVPKSGSNSLGKSPSWVNFVVFLGTTQYSQSACTNSDVIMGTGEFNLGVSLAMDQHPIEGGVVFRNRHEGAARLECNMILFI